VIVGGADLTVGTANGNEIHAIGTAPRARQKFGHEDESRLTKNIIDALGEGATPVIGIAPEESTASKDLSSLSSTSGTLDKPAKEDVESMSVTVDSSSKTVSLVYEDPSTLTPASGEVLLNPATGDFELDVAPSSAGTFEYTAVHYEKALDELALYDGDVDFYAALKEDPSVVNYLVQVATQRANEYLFGLCVAGVVPNADPSSWSNPYDTSRLQLIAPPRDADGNSLLGHYAGARADIGLNTTAINQRLSLDTRPLRALNETQRGNFINKHVTPLETLGNSARVADDLTTVSDDNTQEQNFRYGFSRLAVDFLVRRAHELEEPFVGQLNTSLGVLRDLLDKEARRLTQSNVVNSYNTTLELLSPDTVQVTFQADVAEPVRFIQNDFVIGNSQ
jgi:hypothetical protein